MISEERNTSFSERKQLQAHSLIWRRDTKLPKLTSATKHHSGCPHPGRRRSTGLGSGKEKQTFKF